MKFLKKPLCCFTQLGLFWTLASIYDPVQLWFELTLCATKTAQNGGICGKVKAILPYIHYIYIFILCCRCGAEECEAFCLSVVFCILQTSFIIFHSLPKPSAELSWFFTTRTMLNHHYKSQKPRSWWMPWCLLGCSVLVSIPVLMRQVCHIPICFPHQFLSSFLCLHVLRRTASVD